MYDNRNVKVCFSLNCPMLTLSFAQRPSLSSFSCLSILISPHKNPPLGLRCFCHSSFLTHLSNTSSTSLQQTRVFSFAEYFISVPLNFNISCQTGTTVPGRSDYDAQRQQEFTTAVTSRHGTDRWKAFWEHCGNESREQQQPTACEGPTTASSVQLLKYDHSPSLP